MLNQATCTSNYHSDHPTSVHDDLWSLWLSIPLKAKQWNWQRIWFVKFNQILSSYINMHDRIWENQSVDVNTMAEAKYWNEEQNEATTNEGFDKGARYNQHAIASVHYDLFVF